MNATDSVRKLGQGIVVTLAVVAIAAHAYAGAHFEQKRTPQDTEKIRLIGVSRFDELPPVPAGARPDLEAQLTGVPTPLFRMLSDEEMVRGGAGSNGAATAIVYRNSHDSGWANLSKADVGNFTGNLLHLGNGFPVTGGEISGYDLLVYNMYTSNTTADVVVSLWDGDPLGFIDTRISDPPQMIPGTLCTFTGLVQGGTGSNGCIDGFCDGGYFDGEPCNSDADCGLCPALPGDDIPECPGLYRLECNFADDVMIPSRNVWMILEVTDGCRLGWRWAFEEGPEIAAVGEENFCFGSCPALTIPCVDLAIEMVEAVSQWDQVGVGTC